MSGRHAKKKHITANFIGHDKRGLCVVIWLLQHPKHAQAERSFCSSAMMIARAPKKPRYLLYFGRDHDQ
jgi:hypothetical protein